MLYNVYELVAIVLKDRWIYFPKTIPPAINISYIRL